MNVQNLSFLDKTRRLVHPWGQAVNPEACCPRLPTTTSWRVPHLVPLPSLGTLIGLWGLISLPKQSMQTPLCQACSPPSAVGGREEWVHCQLPWCRGLGLGPGQIYSYSEFFPCYLVEGIGWVTIGHESHLVSF